jgi:hypothetical protein
MKLLYASIWGYRRFADEISVRLSETPIALVGPNEAGKSSFLDAIRLLSHNEPIPQRDVTRRSSLSPQISLTFQLEESDQDALEALGLQQRIVHCTLWKDKGGHLELKFDLPYDPDTQPRLEAYKQIGKAMETLGRVGNPAAKREPLKTLLPLLGRAQEELDKVNPRLSARSFATLRGLRTHLERSSNSKTSALDLKSALGPVSSTLGALLEAEEASLPFQAESILRQRLPQILYFDEASRDLKSSYDLSVEPKTRPPALVNLALLANLDLKKLARATRSKDLPHVQELQNGANEVLRNAFSRWWIRSDVAPAFHVDGSTLHIHVSTPEGGLSAVDERSDGLRWFISLVAFLAAHPGIEHPIILVDEAERHLSYDAQASLVAVLETQKVAQRIIYTTHSAGCLPSDLGTGIRPVIPLRGERSRIANGFWTIGPGFSPLMLAMGLGPLAFTPARNVVLGEGASECLLLPTLLREATKRRRLPFQVGPGAANISKENFSDMRAEAGRVAFVVDGDVAGEKTKQALIEAGADPDEIKSYKDFFGDAIVFEDLIEPERYVAAFNEELNGWQKRDEKLTAAELPEVGRASFVDDWCQQRGMDPVSKPTLCQRLVEKATEGAAVLAADKAAKLNELFEWLVSRFEPNSKEQVAE